MIHLENVSLTYGSKTVLRQASLDILSETTHILLGLSGSGKSTLLKVLLGLVQPNEGSVRVDEHAQRWPVDFFWRQQFGYLPQDGGLFPHMTCLDNITLLARTLKWEKKRIEHRIDEIVPLASLDRSLLKRFPKQISGGQRQRVSLLRALFMDPKILLFDEPLGALDPLIRNDLQSELKKLFSDLGKTVVFVTHDVTEAAYLGDRISLLRSGQVLQTGSMSELSQDPKTKFVSQFLQAQRQLKDLENEL